MDSEIEKRMIDLFVLPSKKERLKGFVESGKRDKLVSALNSPGIFNPKYLHEFQGGVRNSKELSELYKKMGMGGRVYVISENGDWDGQRFQMSYLLDQALAACIDTFAYCWKSNTAFYEWHHSGASYFLSWKKNA